MNRPLPRILARLLSPLAPVVALAVSALALAACDCELPDTWEGGTLDGCSAAGDVECCSYSTSRCSYTVCMTACGEPEQASWYCY